MQRFILLVSAVLAMVLAPRAGAVDYYFGADLSYVNELEDCGAQYRQGNERKDAFELLHSRGANLMRVRLWNDARWTRYSNLADVKKTIARARKAGMQVLLDYHYSDDWADGDKQIIPKAWEPLSDDPDALAAALYEFTVRTLRELDAEGLMPELVQVGNETNGEMLSTLERAKNPIDWTRNAKFLNAGIRAVRDAGARSTVRPRVMLHIAQPENVEPWFAAAAAAGVTDFDLIGISYYRRWSTQDLDGLFATINRLRHRYPADVMVVEAAYPWTLEHRDEMPNLLGADTLLPGYPATQDGQRRYLVDLTQQVIANGGVGVVYWEPAWISSSCKTRWGTGSSWENATLFDFAGRLLPGADYLDFPYAYPVDVELSLQLPASSRDSVLYFWADFLGESAAPIAVPVREQRARFSTRLMPATPMRLQWYRDAGRTQPVLHADSGANSLVNAVVGIEATRIDLSDRLRTCNPCASLDLAANPIGNFNAGWQFHRFAAPETDPRDLAPADWEEVTLPHTTRVEPRVVNDQWQGFAVYRKRFDTDPQWRGKRVWLRFEGAMNVARVSLNGKMLVEHLGGYLPFVVDLSEILQPGSNELIVQLDNRDNAITGPKPLKLLDFNTYGGLYRDVTLVVKEPVHITDEILEATPAGGGIFVTYPEVTTTRARIAVKTHVRNRSSRSTQLRVLQSLWQDDRQVAEMASNKQSLRSAGAIDVNLQLTVDQPQLWSPQSPALYWLVTRVESDGRIVDEQRTRIGIRSIEFAGGSFRINGQPLYLRGVNRHQEYPYVGYAIPAEADYRDAKRIKEAGFDLVRLSHYPHSRHFMAAADELGLVLLDAIPGWQFFNPDPAFERQVLQTCRDLVRRDRNHPSVIAWECSLNETQMPVSLVKRLDAIVHEEYPGSQAYSAGWQNDGYDIYLQARQHRLEHYEKPDRPYFVSEYGDWEYYALNAGFQQHAWADLQPVARTSRQALDAGEARLLQQATNNQEAHNDNLGTPAFGDGYWAMFDYNRGYADDLETSGTMSLERVPKFNYQFFRSQRDAQEVSALYESGPFVHIANYWQPGSTRQVRVFGNVDEVELRLNGRSLGRRSADRDRISDRLRHAPFTFALQDFEPGALEAVGYRQGRVLAWHRVVTPEAVAAVEIELDSAGICGGPQEDLLFARARLVDRNGTVVPQSGSEVVFAMEAGGVLIGPASQSTEAGIASALLRTDSRQESVRIKAVVGPLSTQLATDATGRCRQIE